MRIGQAFIYLSLISSSFCLPGKAEPPCVQNLFNGCHGAKSVPAKQLDERFIANAYERTLQLSSMPDNLSRLIVKQNTKLLIEGSDFVRDGKTVVVQPAVPVAPGDVFEVQYSVQQPLIKTLAVPKVNGTANSSTLQAFLSGSLQKELNNAALPLVEGSTNEATIPPITTAPTSAAPKSLRMLAQVIDGLADQDSGADLSKGVLGNLLGGMGGSSAGTYSERSTSKQPKSLKMLEERLNAPAQ